MENGAFLVNEHEHLMVMGCGARANWFFNFLPKIALKRSFFALLWHVFGFGLVLHANATNVTVTAGISIT